MPSPPPRPRESTPGYLALHQLLPLISSRKEYEIETEFKDGELVKLVVTRKKAPNAA